MGSSSWASSDPSPGNGDSSRDHPVVDLLNINEVAAALRVSKMTVYRFIGDGRLPAIRLGSSLRVHRRDLESYLAAAFLPPLGTNPGTEAGGTMSDPLGL